MESRLSAFSSMNGTEYKKLHESFMQNNPGSSPFHVILCIFFTVQCVLLTSIKHLAPGDYQYFREYLLIILPLTIANTVLSDYIYFLNTIVFALLLYNILKSYPKLRFSVVLSQKNEFQTRIQAITGLRSMTYVITVFCILAVDFQAFPRYLAKTEWYGISLMDTGVGLFVLMSGLVHKDSRKNTWIYILKSNLKFVSILLILGIARFVTIKQLDYQEHVTEYGVHWNFFFTLALCKVISTILLHIYDRPLLLSILLISIHEFLLEFKLKNWVLSNLQRNNMFDANREGISSSLGYISLYLFGAFVKHSFNDKSVTRSKLLLNFFATALSLYFLQSVAIFGNISRVLVNSAYCIFVVVIFLLILMVLYLFEVLYQDLENKAGFKVPVILSAVNNNGLLYFLAGNLLTGVVNMTIRTLFVSTLVTLIILNIYMAVTIALAVFLEKKGIKI